MKTTILDLAHPALLGGWSHLHVPPSLQPGETRQEVGELLHQGSSSLLADSSAHNPCPPAVYQWWNGATFRHYLATTQGGSNL